MLVLHFAPDNASVITRLALEEAGLAYTAAPVDREAGALDSPEYRRLNPAGMIPVLETPEGALFETGAILLWLADRPDAEGLAPGATDARRGDALKWLFFLATTVHADLRQIFYPDRYAPAGAAAEQFTLLTGRMTAHFGILDRAVAADPSLFSAPSVLSAYLCVLLRWCALYAQDRAPWFDIAAWPALQSLARATETRSASVRVAAAEGLGPLPFSAPSIAPA